ncbi:MAG: hypothetical protein AB7G93_15145 [Bdellovibrionales bacterium]
MRHNKFIGWDTFLSMVDQVQRVSPWLSRQIAKHASEWPYWYSGLRIKDWRDNQVWVHLPLSFRNAIEGEVCLGHMQLGADLCMRLLLLRYRQEFPFRYRVMSSRGEIHHMVNQSVDFRFSISQTEWERLRLDLSRDSRGEAEFACFAYLTDGRLAGTFTFHLAFTLEKFLPA